MSEEEQTLLMIRGAISSLDEALREKVNAAYGRIVAMESEFGVDAVALAVGLRGSEFAAQ